MHRLHQAGHGDGKHEAAGQPGHDQPGARDDGHDPDGQHGDQGRRSRCRDMTRREQQRRIVLPAAGA
jgi:hypothetical protein